MFINKDLSKPMENNDIENGAPRTDWALADPLIFLKPLSKLEQFMHLFCGICVFFVWNATVFSSNNEKVYIAWHLVNSKHSTDNYFFNLMAILKK